MDTFRLKEWIRDSPTAQRAYLRMATTIGVWQARRGENLKALRTLFPAWRNAIHVPVPEACIETASDVIQRKCFEAGRVVAIQENGILREFLTSSQAGEIKERFASYPLLHRVRLRIPRENDNPERQGNLILLKRHNPVSGEKGVIFLKYTETFVWFAAVYDLQEIASRYTVVLEPSSSGYQDWKFLLYVGRELDVVVFSPYPPDFEFIESLNANLVPVRLGAGDWVDPDTFQPDPAKEPKFDLVMVSAWHPIKRHDLLFQALKERKESGEEDLSVALVGYPLRWPRSKIERMMKKYGVESQCTIFEDIPHREVAEVVSSSKAFLLLSRHEGANKSLYESLFCDTPVIVYRNHRGVNPDHVPSEVGVRFREGELKEAIKEVLASAERFEPRRWALAHTGWPRATERLNEVLATMAKRRGTPWNETIVPKKNSPNLVYAEPGRYREFDEEYEGLKRFLRPA